MILPMKEISPSDLLEVRPQSLFSTQDYTYLLDFYAPIIGVKSVGVFFALINVEAGEILSHKAFFTKNQLSSGEFIAALAGLEAMGLVQTFKKVEEEYQLYCYCTYSPRTPKEFLGNELLAGTLAKYIGQEAVDKLAKKYQLEETPNDFENVSQSFQAFFSPDLSDPIYGESAKNTGGHTLGSVNTGFDRNAFMKALKALDYRFNFDSFTKIEFVKIARIAALYNYEEETVAGFVREAFTFSKPMGERLNAKYLAKLAEDNYKFSYLRKTQSKSSKAHGDSELARSIRQMETMTPIEFLSKLQKGNKPAKPDIDLINTLTVDMGLSSPVCNALILYVTTTHNNTLPATFTQKIAGSLVREGVETVVDAINYFAETSKANAKKKTARTRKDAKPVVEEKQAVEEPVEEKKENKDDESDIMTAEEMEDFLNNIDIGE